MQKRSRCSEVPRPRAISQALSVVIVIAIIVLAFFVYALDSVSHQPSTYTVTITHEDSIITMTEYVVSSGYRYITYVVNGNCTQFLPLDEVYYTTTTYFEPNTTGYYFATATTTVYSNTITHIFSVTTTTTAAFSCSP